MLFTTNNKTAIYVPSILWVAVRSVTTQHSGTQFEIKQFLNFPDVSTLLYINILHVF